MNKAKKVVSYEMMDKAEEGHTELRISKRNVYASKGLNINRKEVEEGKCMRVNDKKMSFSEKERGKVWKVYMEMIIFEKRS